MYTVIFYFYSTSNRSPKAMKFHCECNAVKAAESYHLRKNCCGASIIRPDGCVVIVR